jgi:hypothetical protein
VEEMRTPESEAAAAVAVASILENERVGSQKRRRGRWEVEDVDPTMANETVMKRNREIEANN